MAGGLEGLDSLMVEDRPKPERPRPRRRPRPPRRRGVEYLRDILLTLGILVLGFQAWRVFWTDVQAEQANDAAVESYLGETAVDEPDSTRIALPQDGEPPVPVAVDGILGVMRVPEWGADYTQAVGDSVEQWTVLNVIGAGHYPDTALAGQVGNFSVAGHRTGYGSAFRDVDTLEAGDTVIFQTADHWYVYEVYGHEIVDPSDNGPIQPVPYQQGVETDQRLITLTTCHPLYYNTSRWAVHGEFTYWANTADGIPAELAAVTDTDEE